MIRTGISRLPAVAAVMLALAACSSTRLPSGAGDGKGADKGASAPAAAGARRGAYYLDDGPGDAPPVDLDAIPNAVPRAEPLNPRTARPYVVFDRRYVPMTSLEPYRERGVATWYGRRYHGQRTSSGEVYDMYAMTAAHPTLPIPSYVRVTHLGNGRSVVVRVNDRGPFLSSRLIDLSYTAAAKLGYVNAGSAEVEVELITRFGADAGGLQAVAPSVAPALAATGVAASEGLGAGPLRLELETVVAPAPPAPAASNPSTPVALTPAARNPAAPAAATAPTPAAPTPVGTPAAGSAAVVYLQFGAFSSRTAAEAARVRLARELDSLVKDVEVRQDGALFKVHAGPYASRADALAVAQRVERAGASRPVLVAR